MAQQIWERVTVTLIFFSISPIFQGEYVLPLPKWRAKVQASGNIELH